ncbi:BED-type domain-containing protein, partial [Aphis craccivora]
IFHHSCLFLNYTASYYICTIVHPCTLQVLPCETKWGTYSDCLETLLDNWHIISKVCTDNRSSIDPNINCEVHDMCLKRNMENHLVPLKKISIANDKVQSDICILSEVTDIWINLVNVFKTLYEENQIPLSMVQKLESRFDMAFTPAHYLAYILDPRFRGIKLEEKQNEEAMDFVLAYHSDILPDILKYKANTHPFKECMFSETAVGDSVHPLTWWKSICKDINSETMEVVNQLHTAVASSAGVERVFQLLDRFTQT